jgi:probable blue pigment (indigoidine) exporter
MATIALPRIHRPSSLLRDLALTSVAPMAWGTTYVVTTTMLPPGRPLLASTLRALPAGLILLAYTRRLPTGSWWWRSLVLGILNFGAFFPLLFVAAYRLPGGGAATISAIQPLVVALFSLLILRAAPNLTVLLAALTGVAGVGLLTLTAAAELDPVGIAASVAATTMMGLAVVLAKRWGRPEGVTLLTFTGWQLAIGGLILAPITLFFEGIPASLSGTNLLGYLYLGSLGAIVAYALWFRGIERLPATSVSLLGLTNPLVATLAGLVILGQTLTPGQLLGFAIALTGLIAGQRALARER